MTAAFLSLLLPALLAAGPDLTGRVETASGSPAIGAHVLIESAGHREGANGSSSGFPDCRKRALTDADGRFRIESVDPDLILKVLVVADGFRPEYAAEVDPARGPITVKLTPFDPAQFPADRMIRGVVLDPDGRPLAGARVSPSVIWTATFKGFDPDLFDAVAFANGKGEFTLTSTPPIEEGDLRVEGDGVAPQIVPRLAPGRGRHRITTTRGATVIGRIDREGKPVADAAVGLLHAEKGFTALLGEATTRTDQDGRFTFDHVHADEDYFVHGPIGSFGDGGALVSRPVGSGPEGTTTDAGTLPVVRGHRLEGQVILADGKPIPARTRLTVSRESARDDRTVELDPEGRFGLDGLPTERYTISVPINGYRVSPRNRSADPSLPWRLTGKIDADIAGLKLLMEALGPPGDGALSMGGLTTVQATLSGKSSPPPPARRLPPPER